MLFSDPQSTSPVRDDATFELPEIFRLPQVITVQGLPDGWKVKRVRHEGRDVTYAPTDFGASREPIEVTVTNRLARPVVRVKDAEGQAVTDARVLAVPAAAKPGRRRSARSTAGPRPTATSSSARCRRATTSSSHSASTN